jgi:hypothetical protein
MQATAVERAIREADAVADAFGRLLAAGCPRHIAITLVERIVIQRNRQMRREFPEIVAIIEGHTTPTEECA